ncbi:MAG: DEAD/DEAH box helicase [Planctomycetes bacterium]|nr:DEAD/DEAH box helicase [Planctomycetota bacterium]
MTLHPITVVDQVLDEYRSYLSTEFRARDARLRDALESALAERGFLAQEPFFQAHRPFKPGRRWRDLGLDAGLSRVMEERTHSETAFLHQSESIAQLLSPGATPIAVTTGTGSGKTECFLLPVLQNAIEDAARFKRPGLMALLVYPMNALANDQEERIRGILERSRHTYIRGARYDRSTKEEERARLRRDPPHVLLTNYMMLEYLLVRPADRTALFANHRYRCREADARPPHPPRLLRPRDVLLRP